MSHLVRQACSFLFVPATHPERLPKALASGADVVIADWEDAVAPADKAAARAALAQAVAPLDAAQRARLLVRINAEGTPWFADDLRALAALVAQGCAGAVVPKAESAATLQAAAQAAGVQAALLPLVESVAGLDAVDTLATWTFRSMPASPAVTTKPSCCRCAWPWCWPRAAPGKPRRSTA